MSNPFIDDEEPTQIMDHLPWGLTVQMALRDEDEDEDGLEANTAYDKPLSKTTRFVKLRRRSTH